METKEQQKLDVEQEIAEIRNELEVNVGEVRCAANPTHNYKTIQK